MERWKYGYKVQEQQQERKSHFRVNGIDSSLNKHMQEGHVRWEDTRSELEVPKGTEERGGSKGDQGQVVREEGEEPGGLAFSGQGRKDAGESGVNIVRGSREARLHEDQSEATESGSGDSRRWCPKAAKKKQTRSQ